MEVRPNIVAFQIHLSHPASRNPNPSALLCMSSICALVELHIVHSIFHLWLIPGKGLP